MMRKREIEREWDREGKKVNKMERKSRQGRQGAEEGGKEIFIWWKRMDRNNYGNFEELHDCH